MSVRILVAPAAADAQELQNTLALMAFHFGHVDLRRLDIAVEPEFRAHAQQIVAAFDGMDGMDSAIARRFGVLRDKVRILSPARAIERNRLYDFVLVLDELRFAASEIAEVATGRSQTLVVVDLDDELTTLEVLSETAFICTRLETATRTRSAARMRETAERLSGLKRCYLVGDSTTGPDLLDEPAQPGLGIFDAGALFNRRLVERFVPDLVTFSDPVLAFGPSEEAGQFRTAIADAVLRMDLAMVLHERYALTFASLVPSIEERIITVRSAHQSTAINLDLVKALQVNPDGDVLTTVMLPLAATFAHEICTVGVDDLRLGGSGEAARNEAVARLGNRISAIEAAGKHLIALSASNVVPLRQRTATPPTVAQQVAWIAEGTASTPGADGRIVMLDPSWVGSDGHYEGFNETLRLHAQAAGLVYLSLTSIALERDRPWQVPAFRFRSWRTSTPGRYGEIFGEDLGRALSAIRQVASAGDTSYVMYTAAIWQLPQLCLAAARCEPGEKFVVNLMELHGELARLSAQGDAAPAFEIDLLRECQQLSTGLPLTCTVDTEAFADDVEALTGIRPAVWPMFAIGQLPSFAPITRGDPISVLYPGKHTVPKGFLEFAKLADSLASDPPEQELRLVCRLSGYVGEVPAVVGQARRGLSAAGVELLAAPETTDDHLRELASHDIIAIPYRSWLFRTRTSAIALDAVAAGRPILVADHTWVADLVREYGLGTVFDESSTADMRRALLELVDNLETFDAQVAANRDAVLSAHAPARLLEFVQACSGSRPVGADDKAAAAQRLVAFARLAFDQGRGCAQGVEVQNVAQSVTVTKLAWAHRSITREVETARLKAKHAVRSRAEPSQTGSSRAALPRGHRWWRRNGKK